MPRGEIIQFPLNRGLEPQSESILNQQPGEKNTEEIRSLMENADFFLNLTKMLEYLTALTRASGPPPKQNIELRRSILLEKSTLKELFEAVINSNEADWRHNPTYYHSVIAEIRRRKFID